MEPIFRPPKPLLFEGNLAENWILWKQQFNLFMKASSKDETDMKEDIKVSIFESSIIRYQVIFGIRDLHVKEVLLRDENITLEKVSEYCRAVEVSKQQIEEFQREASVNINVVERKYVKRDVIDDCNPCGYSHRIRNCPAFEFSKNKKNIQEDESEPDDHDRREEPNEHNCIDLYVSEVRKTQIERQQVWEGNTNTKNKTPCELNDLWPITLLPTLSEVLEREVEIQIRQHLNKYEILPSMQSGF
ncbi:hypothetical protein JTB14_029065 [Gonioctena quinquepunctata]|nr:hypothetical protein JTB14_029065 [Gonioctena quinquepunctata]